MKLRVTKSGLLAAWGTLALAGTTALLAMASTRANGNAAAAASPPPKARAESDQLRALIGVLRQRLSTVMAAAEDGAAGEGHTGTTISRSPFLKAKVRKVVSVVPTPRYTPKLAGVDHATAHAQLQAWLKEVSAVLPALYDVVVEKSDRSRSPPLTYHLPDEVCGAEVARNDPDFRGMLVCGSEYEGTLVPGQVHMFAVDGSVAGKHARFSTCGAGTDMDTLLEVYERCYVSEDHYPFRVAANDDSCQLASRVDWAFADDWDAGATGYFVKVRGFATNAGAYALSLECSDEAPGPAVDAPPPPPAPLRDDSQEVCSAEALAGAPFGKGVLDCGSTVDGHISPGTSDVYVLGPGVAGIEVTLSLCGSAGQLDAVAMLHKGCVRAGDSTDAVAMDDDTCGLFPRIIYDVPAPEPGAPPAAAPFFLTVVAYNADAHGGYSVAVTCRDVSPVPARGRRGSGAGNGVGKGRGAGKGQGAGPEGYRICGASGFRAGGMYAGEVECGGVYHGSVGPHARARAYELPAGLAGRKVALSTCSSRSPPPVDTVVTVWSGCLATGDPDQYRLTYDDDGCGTPGSLASFTAPDSDGGDGIFAVVSSYSDMDVGDYELRVLCDEEAEAAEQKAGGAGAGADDSAAEGGSPVCDDASLRASPAFVGTLECGAVLEGRLALGLSGAIMPALFAVGASLRGERARLSLCDGTDFDSVLEVTRGCVDPTGGDLGDARSEWTVASNDDGCGYRSQLTTTFSGGSPGQGRGGAPQLLAVSVRGYMPDAAGAYSLRVLCGEEARALVDASTSPPPPPPANNVLADDVCSAAQIEASGLLAGTLECGSVVTGALHGAGGVAIFAAAPSLAGETATFSLCDGSDFDSQLGLHAFCVDPSEPESYLVAAVDDTEGCGLNAELTHAVPLRWDAEAAPLFLRVSAVETDPGGRVRRHHRARDFTLRVTCSGA